MEYHLCCFLALSCCIIHLPPRVSKKVLFCRLIYQLPRRFYPQRITGWSTLVLLPARGKSFYNSHQYIIMQLYHHSVVSYKQFYKNLKSANNKFCRSVGKKQQLLPPISHFCSIFFGIIIGCPFPTKPRGLG